MSINMELMRKKLAVLRGEGEGRENSPWFKPEDGEVDIRIVPAPDGDPLKEMYFHYNVGKRNHLSPTTYGEADPILEYMGYRYG